MEEVLYGHPGVAEAAVLGVPHDILSGDASATVVFRPGAE
ncbi:hypothetical protein ABZ490_49890 [Streptomyces sp. NPDC005811]